MRKKRLAKAKCSNKCIKIRGPKERPPSAKFPVDFQGSYIARKELQETKAFPNWKSKNLHKHFSGGQSVLGPLYLRKLNRV